MLICEPRRSVVLELRLSGNPAELEDDTTILWTDEDHAWAEAQGWYLDHQDGLITKDDDSGAFRDADDAIDHVTLLASAGDERAIRAMIFTNHSNVMSWVDRLEEARDA